MATVEQLYQDILGRAPDVEGQQYWQQQFGSSVDPTEMQTFLAAAQPEMRQRGISYDPSQFSAPLPGQPGGDFVDTRPPSERFNFGGTGNLPPGMYGQPYFPDPQPGIDIPFDLDRPLIPNGPFPVGGGFGGSVYDPVTGTESRDLRPLQPDDPRYGVPRFPGMPTKPAPPVVPIGMQVEDLYQQYLGRSSDPGGLEFWTNLFGNEIDPEELMRFKVEANKELGGRPIPAPTQPIFEPPLPGMRYPYSPSPGGGGFGGSVYDPVTGTESKDRRPLHPDDPRYGVPRFPNTPVKPALVPIPGAGGYGGSVYDPVTGYESRDLRPLRPDDPRYGTRPIRNPLSVISKRRG